MLHFLKFKISFLRFVLDNFYYERKREGKVAKGDTVSPETDEKASDSNNEGVLRNNVANNSSPGDNEGSFGEFLQ